MTKDVVIVPISDTHSGSTTALCPNRFMQFKHTNHTPLSEQVQMWEHFERCADEIKEARKGKDLIVVHLGDAVDGVHHNTLQIYTRMINEQAAVHEELMSHFKKVVGFKPSDKLYYVTGTECHVEDIEDLIGLHLGAEHNGNVHAFDELKITVNGRRLWFVHHGPSSGKGANRGNGLRMWLKNHFYDAVHECEPPPHYIVTGHTHDPDWNEYIGRYKGEYFKVQGLICPSWQKKTRYGYKKAPIKMTKVGLQYFTVTKDGNITDPVERLMK